MIFKFFFISGSIFFISIYIYILSNIVLRRLILKFMHFTLLVKINIHDFIILSAKAKSILFIYSLLNKSTSVDQLISLAHV